MIKCIIFDFNRTLYIPELQKIPEETLEVLKNLKKMGFSLVLISIREAEREDIIETYNLSSIFSIIHFVDKKDTNVFKETLQFLKCCPDEVIVVGDRIKSEIKIANTLGIRTIWYKQGKFSNQLPVEKVEFPSWTIDSLPQMIKIIKKINTNKLRSRKSNSKFLF